MTLFSAPCSILRRIPALLLASAFAASPAFAQSPSLVAAWGDLPPATAAPPPLVADAPVEGPAAPPPFGRPLFERQKLTGDWFGTRDNLRDHGITWDISSTNIYAGVADGGLQRKYLFGGRGDAFLHVDGEKAGLWKGLFIDLHAETLYGRSINGSTGAIMPVDLPLAVPTLNPPITALTRVKVTQALSENFVTYFGKLNMLDEFNQPFTGGARGTDGFMNGAMVFNPVLARTIPYSTYGAGFAVLKDLQPVLGVLVLDSNNTPTVSGFDTFFDRGASIVATASLPTKFFDLPGHQGIAATYSSTKYAALDDLPFFLVGRLRGLFPPLRRETGSWSVAYMFDQTIGVDPCDPKRSWGVFGNAGLSDGNPNPIRWAANVGIGGASPFRCRNLDTFGAGFYYVGISEDLKNIAPRRTPIRDEKGVELFYNVGVTPWLHITPDVQFVTPIRTGTDSSVNVGLRAKIDF